MSTPLPEVTVPDATSRFNVPAGEGFVRWFAVIRQTINVLGVEVLNRAVNAAKAEIVARKLISSDDPRLPEQKDAPGLLVAIRDAVGNRTWLEASDVDGGPTPEAARLLGPKLGVGPDAAPGYLLALADADRNMTDLAIRSTDGQVPQFIIDRWKPRILEGFAPPEQRLYADTVWQDGAGLFPVRADSTRAAGWGSSSMAGIDTRFGTLFGGFGAAYYGGGKSGERAESIAARMGAVPALITVTGGAIPPSGSVAVTSSNMPVSDALRSYPGTLAGVAGELSYKATAPAGYVFTRNSAGATTAVPNDTPFLPDARAYRDTVTILWMGKNNVGDEDAVATVTRLTDACFDWLAPFEKRCLVLGHFVNTGTTAGHSNRTQILDINAAYAARYGALYVDVNGYLTSPQVWADSGITPTQEDLDQQALGNKPPSLSSDSGHMNAAGYTAVTEHLIRPRLTTLNWY